MAFRIRSLLSSFCWVLYAIILGLPGTVTTPPPGIRRDVTMTSDASLAEDMGSLNVTSAAVRPDLAMDQAWLSIRSRVPDSLDILHQNGQCFGCPLQRLESVSADNVTTVVLQTKFSNILAVRLSADMGDIWCRDTIQLRQGGDYWLVVRGNSTSGLDCQLLLANDPPNIYLPILYLFVALMCLAIVWTILKMLARKGLLERAFCWRRSVDLVQQFSSTTALEMKGDRSGPSGSGRDQTNNNPPVQTKTRDSRRLVSLDTFRGFSLCVMMFSNYGGGGYWFFRHPPWNGLTVADLVFPWFVFIMGTAMAFSFRGMLKRRVTRTRMVWHIVRRTCLLFLIGVSLNSRWFSPLDRLRIPGVLQRLALTYFLTAIPHMMFTKREQNSEGRHCWGVADLVDFWPEWIVQAGYLAVHLGLTFGLAVPGCPRGYLGPGGLHDGGRYFNCSGGSAGYIDRLILTDNHIYQYPEFKTIYGATQSFDPEGILGTLSSAFMCFLGVQAGNIVVYHKSHQGRIIRWTVWAVLTGAIGTLLCKASLNDGWIPINKNLWSVSFSLVTSALAFLFLVAMYVVIDVCDVWNGAPFFYPGMNSLVVYVCHEVFATFLPVRWPVEEVHWKLLAINTWSTCFWIILAFVLYRKQIFVAL